MRPMFAARGLAAASSSIAFVSQACLDSGNHLKYSLKKNVRGIKNTRNIGKKDMILNNLLPKISVDPETYKVQIEGFDAECAPATVLPLSQRYFLF